MNELRYTLVSGDLPLGVKLNRLTGDFGGEAAFSNVSAGPMWDDATPVTGTSLGSFNEGEVVTLTNVKALGRSSEIPFKSYSVVDVGDGLPWGLTLHPTTGVIAGTVGEVKTEQAAALDTKNENPPTWTTSFGRLSEVNEGSPINIPMVVVPVGAKTITRYNVVTGALPFGITLHPTTGLLAGTTSELLAFETTAAQINHGPPTWVITQLNDMPKTGNLSQTLQATAVTGNTIVSYQIVGGQTPPGFSLNPTTGALLGVPSTIVTEVADLPINPPIWTTASGALVQANEETSISIPLVAVGTTGRTVVSFATVDGAVPFGLTVHPTTGLLSGKLFELQAAEDVVVPTIGAPPTWTTVAGTLLGGREGDAVNTTLAASARTNNTISQYQVVDGFLPYGLELNPTTGRLFGNLSEVVTLEPNSIDPDTDPVILDTQVINGTTMTTTNGQLGTFNAGSALNISIKTTATSGRTLTSLNVDQLDVLPKGLTLHPLTFVLAGTISTQAVKGQYNFILRVRDSAGASSTKTFSLTIQ